MKLTTTLKATLCGLGLFAALNASATSPLTPVEYDIHFSSGGGWAPVEWTNSTKCVVSYDSIQIDRFVAGIKSVEKRDFKVVDTVKIEDLVDTARGQQMTSIGPAPADAPEDYIYITYRGLENNILTLKGVSQAGDREEMKTPEGISLINFVRSVCGQ